MTGRGKFAKDTKVSEVESRQELETLLRRYGFHEFGVFHQPRLITVLFQMGGAGHRLVIPLPDPGERRFTHTERDQPRAGNVVGLKTPEEMYRQEVAARWRALLLVLKAQLEYLELIGEPPARALAHYRVLPGNRTVAEAVLEHGVMPPALTWGAE